MPAVVVMVVVVVVLLLLLSPTAALQARWARDQSAYRPLPNISVLDTASVFRLMNMTRDEFVRGGMEW